MSADIELRHLRYFVAVAEELHFGKAAIRLGIAQPPLSQQIRRLENHLGHQLLERTTRGVKLTPAGHALLDRARRTLAKVQDDVAAVQQVGRGEVGTLTVGFAGSSILTALPQALHRYQQQYPRVDLRLREQFTTAQVEGLYDGTIEVGLLRDPSPADDLVLQPILREPFVAVLSARHPLAGQPSLALSALRDEPFVLFPRSGGPAAFDKVLHSCLKAGFTPKVTQEAPHWQTIVRLVEAGFGVSIAPACVARLASKGLVYRRLRGVRETTEITLGHLPDQRNPAVPPFLQIVRQVFARYMPDRVAAARKR